MVFPRRIALLAALAIVALAACSSSDHLASRDTWGDLSGDLLFAHPDADAGDVPGPEPSSDVPTVPADVPAPDADAPAPDGTSADALTGDAPPDTSSPDTPLVDAPADASCGVDTPWACLDDHAAARCLAGHVEQKTCGADTCQAGQCVCASVSQSATQTPLDLFVMMDRSYSMSHPTGTGLGKWQAVTQALQVFLNDPGSAGISVGIQFFPLWFGACDSCSPADYAKADVAIGPLPGNAQAIVDAMIDHEPSNDTPTYAALKGAVDFARSHAITHPSHTVAVIFATDGEPTECDPMDIPTIAGVAATAAAATPAVRTFVVGVGSLPSLDAIAEAGGTTKAFHVDESGDVVVQFGAALQAIHGQALGCTYVLPTPADGGLLDLAKVNVQVTPTGSAPVPVPYVAAPAGCAPDGGWLFDDPVQPAQIVLCPQTCDALTADPGAKVEVLLGCVRYTKDPQ